MDKKYHKKEYKPSIKEVLVWVTEARLRRACKEKTFSTILAWTYLRRLRKPNA